ncbi:MAG: prolyl oligopeptidase family serine peptidase, partial [Oceanococcaceae bacterium]
DASNTRRWVEAQQALADRYLAGLPGRRQVEQRLQQILQAPSWDSPATIGQHRYLSYHDGQSPQPVLLQESLDGSQSRVVLDVNTLSADGTTALKVWVVSPKGHYLAYGVTQAGEDWTQIRIRRLQDGVELSDSLRFVKFSNIAWTKDEAGFFYSRYPDREGTFDTLSGQAVWYHRVGTPQSADIRVYQDANKPLWNYWAEVDDSGRWLLLSVREGATDANRLVVRDLGRPLEPALFGPTRVLVADFAYRREPIGVLEDVLYVHSTANAPKGRVRAIDLGMRNARWMTVVPESEDTLERAILAGGSLVTQHLADASARLRQWSPLGEPQGDLTPEGLGAIEGLSGSLERRELFFERSSSVEPRSIWKAELGSGEVSPWRGAAPVLDPALVVTERLQATSKDGTQVPYFLTRLRTAKADRSRPAWLYGYGGFNIPVLPEFRSYTPLWVENGGIFVVANLRGGGEFGEAWHKAGTKLQKQNVFDDFIAVAEDLIARGWTSPEHLAIHGRSNGGLLVGAVTNQRPELFAAAMPGVGVMDMLRFHKFTIGWAWTVDYGSSDNPEEFRALRAFSPYHNVRSGVEYPAVLGYTADHDDRVVPGHSFKYMAALQAADTGSAPKLLRIESQGGHGAGKPMAAKLAEARDLLLFAAHHTGLRWSTGDGSTRWSRLVGAQ